MTLVERQASLLPDAWFATGKVPARRPPAGYVNGSKDGFGGAEVQTIERFNHLGYGVV
jgi:hypothetical protein